MAAILPSDVFAGYEYVAANGTVTADSIVIPLSAIPQLSAAEAHETTGNGAQLIRALDVAIHAAILALPENERPAKIKFVEFVEATSTYTRSRSLTRTYQEGVAESAYDLLAE